MRYLFAALFACVLAIGNTSAQTIAYVDAEALIQQMPEYKRAQSELEAYSKQLQKQLESKQGALQKFYQEVMQQSQTLSPVEVKEKEAELMKMQEDLQKAAVKADEDLLKKEQSLTEPIYKKFNEAVQKVAKEKGYGYVVDEKLFLSTVGGIDATSAIKAALGL